MTMINKSSDDERVNPAVTFLNSLYNIRRIVEETKIELRGSGIDPFTPFINNQTGHNRSLMDAHKANTSALISYRDHILPQRNHTIRELWNEELSTLSIGNETVEVSLDNLDVFDYYYVTVERTSTGELSSNHTEQEQVRVWIPLKTATDVSRQLDECLNELGWAAEPETPESTASDRYEDEEEAPFEIEA